MAFFATTSAVGPVQMTNSPHGHLREISAFLRVTPDAWTKGNEARTKGGDGVDPMSPWARSWCMLGLMERFIPNNYTRQVALGMLMRVMPKRNGCAMPVHVFNDTHERKLEEVIATLDLAATVPPGKPMDQDEYCAISKAYNRATASKAFIGDYIPKIPDWSMLASPADNDPLAEARNALKDFDMVMAIINREAGRPLAAA